MSVLSVENLGKVFRSYSSETQRIRSWFSQGVAPLQEHWVLRHIDFRLTAGMAVGIVGRNGAGKSTLLKLITGTLVPSEGRVAINGRVGSILELGLGFNPVLTGRQNAWHSLSLMGYSSDEIEAVIPQVESFAELHEYFDESVRVYSSGMQMRLAFSVVTTFRPDILIVDEALAVGDAYFQHKSLGRIREFREQGTTLLIVSHDRAAMLGLCDRVIVLEQGRVIKDGDPIEAMDYYNAIIGDQGLGSVRSTHAESGRSATVSGSGEAGVAGIALYNMQGEVVDCIEVGQSVSLLIEVDIHADIDFLVLGYMLRDRLGQAIYGTNTYHRQQVLTGLKKGERIVYRFDFEARLGSGSYSVSTALTSTENHHANNYEWRDLALVFEVVNRNHSLFAGCNWMEPEIEIERRPLRLISCEP